MMNCEDGMSTPDYHIKIHMEKSSDLNGIFELAVMKTSDYDKIVDTAVSSYYRAETKDIYIYIDMIQILYLLHV